MYYSLKNTRYHYLIRVSDVYLIPIRLPSLSRRFRNPKLSSPDLFENLLSSAAIDGGCVVKLLIVQLPCFLSQMRSRVSTCDSRSGYRSFLSQTRSRVSTYASRSGFHSSVRHISN
ncbi:hypothetical protein HanRHA438_Chr02g0049821 [Helianthus annuus]|nr:hypothetical protein HanIR_Chr02g0054381 [Helianthus annuus]KAJ0617504.1 hypothetical protein HanHA89_Chr02g0042601 [Helianthus annuus]KAJ0776043.1 hypothetical protein HanLR1_Chr02g0041151 [Helianthus annuus]KAJ0938434.1 hypothetical protein HanRHA438_Chr02g0049821 [Helianthus annuus]KAJ0950428.1 hypothetical protein HanPSC8_Chr02g0048171 [Helianthus annuus]